MTQIYYTPFATSLQSWSLMDDHQLSGLPKEKEKLRSFSEVLGKLTNVGIYSISPCLKKLF